MVLPGLRNSA